MRPGQAAQDGLTGTARVQHTALLDGKARLAGTPPASAIARRREIGRLEIVARGNGIELQVISLQAGAAAAIDTPRPPDRRGATTRSKPDNRVRPHRIAVQRAADEGEVVKVQTTGVNARGDRNERASDRRLSSNVRP